MINWRKKRVGGGGYETIVIVLLLILVAPIYILLNWAMSNIDIIQSTLWGGGGYYDASSNMFLNTWWTWLPIIIFFLCIAYLIVRYQRRDPYE